MKNSETRFCEICGARTTGIHASTCDPICTAAKRSGRTRVEQLAWDLDHPIDRVGEIICSECGNYESKCTCIL